MQALRRAVEPDHARENQNVGKVKKNQEAPNHPGAPGRAESQCQGQHQDSENCKPERHPEIEQGQNQRNQAKR